MIAPNLTNTMKTQNYEKRQKSNLNRPLVSSREF